MVFEYLRRLAPNPARAAPAVPPVAAARDEADLDALVARANAETVDQDTSLACPPPPPLGLPRFSGIALADVVLPTPPPPPPPLPRAASLSITAPLASQPRVLLGPGAMTMTLAVVATLVFSVLVATH